MFFNPFDNKVIKEMSFVQRKKLADQIAGTIFVGEKGKENDHWVISAKTMFSFFALYAMQKFGHTTLAELAQAPKKIITMSFKGTIYKCAKSKMKIQGNLRETLKKTHSKPFFASG